MFSVVLFCVFMRTLPGRGLPRYTQVLEHPILQWMSPVKSLSTRGGRGRS
jgi:hypothetical protein